ncbi:hypothetical protein [Sulfobacillus sp. hq2]|uniref:Transposase n=2 Tax=Sulfobacillus thermotolerans TaxID=338644 RepID=G5CIX9_9FIRM|nr:hypothetical protein [Sulfobacillus sp. hq2]AEP14256.1 hypothetical protein [Sulfobacillus thermotolerans]
MNNPIYIDTDFARITVAPKGTQDHEFLLEHALHQLMAAYREIYGYEATVAVLDKLYGYHGRA